jgi:hypothetical protein
MRFPSAVRERDIMPEQVHLLQTSAFRLAVRELYFRAEKQTDWQRLAEVFVTSDLFDRVQSPNSQLVLGRRGTGKTHLLRAFQKDATEHGELALYIDCTILGSGYSGVDLEPEVVGQKYFIAFLNQLGTGLLDAALRMESVDESKQNGVITKLADGLAPTMKASHQPGQSIFNYRQIADSLGQVLRDLGANRVYVILDEWARIPKPAQPHLAEYLKRAVLPTPEICLKILAVNYQCELAVRHNGHRIGLERGADIPDVIDMDKYLVYDEKREFVTRFFAQLLYNHLGVNLGWELSASPERKQSEVIKQLFTQQRPFVELVRAAEGNCRDCLCIFSRAYFDHFRQSSVSKAISVDNVVKAATAWFDAEKAGSVYADRTARETLTYLMQHVLKGYKSRTFLVESGKAEHPRLVQLLNERVLHRLGGTYSHPDRPGIRYDLFTVDYGAFAQLRGTVNEVQEDVFWEKASEGALSEQQRRLMVPVDDKRSIRRITFDPDALTAVGDSDAGAEGPQKRLF